MFESRGSVPSWMSNWNCGEIGSTRQVEDLMEQSVGVQVSPEVREKV